MAMRRLGSWNDKPQPGGEAVEVLGRTAAFIAERGERELARGPPPSRRSSLGRRGSEHDAGALRDHTDRRTRRPDDPRVLSRTTSTKTAG
jgi:hypothetical protein